MESKKGIAIWAVVFVFAVSGTAWATPDRERISTFVDVRALLVPAPLPPASTLAGFLSLNQDDWGWGEEEKTPKKTTPKKVAPKKEEPKTEKKQDWGDEALVPKKTERKVKADKRADTANKKKAEARKTARSDEDWGEEFTGTASDGGTWAGDWGISTSMEEGEKGSEESGGEEEEEEEPIRNRAGRARFGVEFGGLMPVSSKEATYDNGEFAGIYFGFGIADLGGVLLGTDLRAIQGYAKAQQDDNGWSMTTTLVGGRIDLTLHLLPTSPVFNVFYFAGGGAAYEMSTAERIRRRTTEQEEARLTTVMLDTGIGGWLSLFGGIDIVFRFELDYIPKSNNVDLLGIGEMGLQMRF